MTSRGAGGVANVWMIRASARRVFPQRSLDVWKVAIAKERPQRQSICVCQINRSFITVLFDRNNMFSSPSVPALFSDGSKLYAAAKALGFEIDLNRLLALQDQSIRLAYSPARCGITSSAHHRADAAIPTTVTISGEMIARQATEDGKR